MLLRLGFDQKFVDLIDHCISTPYGYLKVMISIRLGDPMSPALFTIYFDILSRLLARAEQDWMISGVKVSRHSPKITHLMYVDDVVIYYNATNLEAMEITNFLQTYCSWTGQDIN